MFLYRLVLSLLAPGVAAWLALRLVRRREGLTDLGERLGGGARAPTGTPVIWLHGASNGELVSARALIDALLARAPELQLVVTTNSLTGRDMVRGWGEPRVSARLAPLDYRVCLRRFLARTRPQALVLLEGDLWPNRLAAMAARGRPVAMVSARISDGSHRAWTRLPGIAGDMMGRVSLLSAQDAASEARFRDLGLPEAALAPPLTLKATVAMPPPDAAALAALAPHFPRGETFLAASTHAGEEEQVIAAFGRARAGRPGLRLILAPRHPARGPEVAALLEAAGLSFATRSAGEMPAPEHPVYLADTLGEMALWYALAGCCFVGASLVPKGGHTPFEPAQVDCAILHGPEVSNFAEAYGALDAAGGALPVADAAALGAALAGLDAAARERLCAAARAALAVDATGDGLGRLLDALAGLDGLAALHRP